MTKTISQYWPGILMGLTLTMSISGCGLRGDLYLDKPEPDQAEAQETAASIDDEITGDWTDRLQIEEPPAADNQSAGTEAAALEGAIAEAAEEVAVMSAPTAVTPTGPDTTIPEPATSDEAENPANIAAGMEWKTDRNISEPSITLAPEGTVPAP